MTCAMTKANTGWFKKSSPPQIFPMDPLGLLRVYGHMVFSKKLEMVTLEYRQLLIYYNRATGCPLNKGFTVVKK